MGKFWKSWSALVIIVLLLLVSIVVAVAQDQIGSDKTSDHRIFLPLVGVSSASPIEHANERSSTTDQLIIRFTPLVQAAAAERVTQVEELSQAIGIDLAYLHEISGDATVLQLPRWMTLKEIRAITERLVSLEQVDLAEPDSIAYPMATPNDPRYGEQWHYSAPSANSYGTNLPAAWDITTGTSNDVVAVIDTGITNHTEFAGRVVQGYDFMTDTVMANDGDGRDANPSDPGNWVTQAEINADFPNSNCRPTNSSWHGTHVAGTIAANSNNNVGVAGINWRAKILPVRVLGKCGGYSSDIIDGIRWAAGLSVPGVPANDNKAQVINLSLGGEGACGSSYQDAINDAVNAGTVVVVAAGNDDANAANYAPASCANVITVSATNRTGNRTYYSNYGATVDISAPGGETYGDITNPDGIRSTLNAGTTTPTSETYAFYEGTSMAAPHVAGIVSLMLSVNPNLTPAQVFSLLQKTVTPFPAGSTCTLSTCGTGIVNAANAVTAAQNPTSEAVRPGFADTAIPANDDSSTGLVPMGFQINFFGALYSQLYVNNNGNFTFNGPLATYTPFGLSSTNQSIIAPFFADVDTRLGSLAKYGPGDVNGKPAFGATWSAVGCYSQITSVLNSFQVILINRSDSGAGNFDIEFNYDQIQWETGTASGGNSSCLGGSSAHVGYSNGANTSFELPGSGIPGSFLDTNQITGLVHSSRNSTQRGRYLFEVRNGTVLTGGQIAGKVLDENLQPLTNALVQVCNAAGFCKLTSTNSLGEYSVSGLEAGQYTVTAFPPAGSNAETGAVGPFTLQTDQVLPGQNIILNLPNGLPTGTTITNLHINADGLPVVYWSSDLTLTTRGCPGGTASYQVTQNATVIRSGTMTEGPAGTYTGIIAAFYPIHGYASVTIQIHCPNNTTETAQFDIYIDPSGHVRTTNGTPIAGATVTLLRASSISGPFVQVPNGDAIMSPANRQNPDTTNIDGRFGWDVIAGFYVVRAAATGCHAPGNATQPFVESAVLTIPPPVTDLDLRLECAPPPPACIQYNVNLDGRKEVPANPSTARGAASIRVNTTNNTLSYYISYTGLSSRETSSHIQGFASVGSNAGVLHTLPLGTSKSGTWTYAEAQEANILAGLSYLNIRSLRYPNGEIRGQIANGITCSTAALAAEVSNLLAEAENSYTIFLPSVAR